MSVPFLKKEKAGYRLLFCKSLYPRKALLKLKEMYCEHVITVSEKGSYFELKASVETEEDCLAICESFLHFAKYAIQS